MDTISLAFVEGSVLSLHRSRAGAASALVDDIERRLARTGAASLVDGERLILAGVLVEHGVVDLNQGRGMTVCDVAPERMTVIAFAINRTFLIEDQPLLD